MFKVVSQFMSFELQTIEVPDKCHLNFQRISKNWHATSSFYSWLISGGQRARLLAHEAVCDPPRRQAVQHPGKPGVRTKENLEIPDHYSKLCVPWHSLVLMQSRKIFKLGKFLTTCEVSSENGLETQVKVRLVQFNQQLTKLPITHLRRKTFSGIFFVSQTVLLQ